MSDENVYVPIQKSQIEAWKAELAEESKQLAIVRDLLVREREEKYQIELRLGAARKYCEEVLQRENYGTSDKAAVAANALNEINGAVRHPPVTEFDPAKAFDGEAFRDSLIGFKKAQEIIESGYEVVNKNLEPARERTYDQAFIVEKPIRFADGGPDLIVDGIPINVIDKP